MIIHLQHTHRLRTELVHNPRLCHLIQAQQRPPNKTTPYSHVYGFVARLPTCCMGSPVSLFHSPDTYSKPHSIIRATRSLTTLLTAYQDMVSVDTQHTPPPQPCAPNHHIPTLNQNDLIELMINQSFLVDEYFPPTKLQYANSVKNMFTVLCVVEGSYPRPPLSVTEGSTWYRQG